MKCNEIITQLAKVLPTLTDKFSESVSISAMSAVGTTVTVTTATAHGLTTGATVLMKGVRVKNPISSLTRVGSVATLTTVNNHDQTDISKGWNQYFAIQGVVESGWNGTYQNTSVPSGKTLTFTISGSPVTPTTGASRYMVETRAGYNGYYQITKIDDTNFSYVVPTTPAGLPEFSVGKVVTQIRIAGADSRDRLISYYTKQAPDKWWGVVILGENVVSKDKSIMTDAVYKYQANSAFEVEVLSEFSLYVIVPYGLTYVTARPQRDEVEDMRANVYKSILGFVPASGLKDNRRFGVVPVRETMFDEPNGAFFVYEFAFQCQFKVVGGRGIEGNGDIIDIDENAAMRGFDITILDNDGTNDLTLRQIEGSVPV